MPSTPIIAMDELDAVNELLESIGQTPVSDLNAPIGDVALARAFIARITRSTQLYGYDFNTDKDYELTPDTDGFLKVPQGTLRFDAMDAPADLKRRWHPDGFWAVWDAENQTWTHEAPVKFRISWAYPFDQMPDSARNYVALSAARKFQKRIIGSDSLDGYNAEDEMKAWILLQRDERASRDTNSFRLNPTMAASVSNRRY